MITPKLRIALISQEEALIEHLKLRLESKGYQAVTFSKLSSVMGFIYADPPNIVIIDVSSKHSDFRTIIKGIKEELYFSSIPVIGLVKEPLDESFDWKSYPFDDFISMPIKYSELFGRITLSLHRIQRIFDNNPLTKLPGNTSIQQAIEKVFGEPMAVCYIDINHFKAYNDTYGFSRGDEVLRMVSRIMSNAVKESGGGFVGHVGGDDFVFIVPMERAESICKTIIDRFNHIVSDLFGDKEMAEGYYIAKDRKGETENIPLLGIAIGVVPTDSPTIRHCGMVSEVAAELKKCAKKSNESCYVIDRRRK